MQLLLLLLLLLLGLPNQWRGHHPERKHSCKIADSGHPDQPKLLQKAEPFPRVSQTHFIRHILYVTFLHFRLLRIPKQWVTS